VLLLLSTTKKSNRATQSWSSARTSKVSARRRRPKFYLMRSKALSKLPLCARNRKLLKESRVIGTRQSRCGTMRQCAWSCTSGVVIEGAVLFLKRAATYAITSVSIQANAHSPVPSARKLSLRVETWAVIWKTCTASRRRAFPSINVKPKTLSPANRASMALNHSTSPTATISLRSATKVMTKARSCWWPAKSLKKDTPT